MCQTSVQITVLRSFDVACSQLPQHCCHLPSFGLQCNLTALGTALCILPAAAKLVPVPVVLTAAVPAPPVLRIGNYVVGDEECPLLYGPPNIRY